ncbi:carbamoyltransferase family protein [Thermococcus thioreducens]|uniref:Carbamoyl transferase n=1 Tax=Thermococcus thioreducens TaxID=277988 RepID=A0A0Q2UQV8_9EURY|nr:carbamoyltransferase [Thermococcus thioreducens]ASJ12325.1 carbamoyl transferase [Thermococcus thioreducens]KQH83056.1 carbamoyl transferase [Thermococcus thioreducens]SEV92802.1 carbamoyltransferase [Thermococcus thioreducens]
MILGIHDGHDAGAVLIDGGRLFAVNEERLNRTKKYRGFPALSLKKVIEMAGAEPEDVEIIAVAGIFRKQKRLLELEENLRAVFGRGFKRKVIFVEHHLAHSASAYYTSGWRDALAVSIDAAGDGLSSSIYIARDGEMIRIAQSTYLDSLGDFYASVTELLGFKPMRHEGKVMSLAAYGRPTYDLSSVIELNGMSFDNHLSLIGVEATRKLAELFDYPLRHAKEIALQMKRGKLEGRLQKKAIEIAASAQAHLEKLIEELGLKLVEKNLPLAYAGGVAQNVKANAVLRKIFGDDNLWVFPAMDDGGLAFGAAVFVKAQLDRLDGRWRPFKLEHVYLGPGYSKEEVEEFLKKEGVKYEEIGNASGFVVDALIDGKLVGFFQGKMEFGPRALGNRSILADPRDEGVKDRLNVALKRDVFQPFAPSLLWEKAGEYLEDLGGKPNEFMTMSYTASEEFREAAPAVVHVDGTTRPQAVRKEVNPAYYDVIKAFERKTGLGAVLNTSFNMHGEPIVCSPEDALRTFRNAGLDLLVIEGFAVWR